MEAEGARLESPLCGRKDLSGRRADSALQLHFSWLLPYSGHTVVAGRDFTWTDIYGLRSYLIVFENFARQE